MKTPIYYILFVIALGSMPVAWLLAFIWHFSVKQATDSIQFYGNVMEWLLWEPESDCNFDFIARAREDVPRLVAALRSAILHIELLTNAADEAKIKETIAACLNPPANG